MGELGSRLIRAREARGLTLEDAERDTRISRRYLEALEAERFEVIPAPVYARGFLRSYSQYLGEDPRELLHLFPREDDDGAANGRGRPSMENPVSGTSASRPTWNRGSTRGDQRQRRNEQDDRGPIIGVRTPPRPSRPGEPGQPARSPGGAGPPPTAPAHEPTIGVDIGVPAPSRRINPSPANQTRTVAILGIAAAAIIAVVLLAVLVSNLGSSDGNAIPGSPTPEGGATATPTTSTAAGAQAGVVPAVEGKPAAEAKSAIQGAGLVVRETRQQNATVAKGSVISQAPAGGVKLLAGQTVNIVVSDGP